MNQSVWWNVTSGVLNVAHLFLFRPKTGGLVGILDTLDIAAYVVDMEAAGKKAWLGLSNEHPDLWPIQWSRSLKQQQNLFGIKNVGFNLKCR